MLSFVDGQAYSILTILASFTKKVKSTEMRILCLDVEICMMYKVMYYMYLNNHYKFKIVISVIHRILGPQLFSVICVVLYFILYV